MIDERTLKTELAELLLAEVGPTEAQIAHREGRIRGIVFALTGEDIGYGCGYYEQVSEICKWLGWRCKPHGSSGWVIDWGNEVDEDALREAGVTLTPDF
jgi:hypothetical protein